MNRNTNERANEDPNDEFPGYPIYPASEDIYSREKEEDLDPETLLENIKEPVWNGALNEKNFNEDKTGEDLDIPGAELDNTGEATGNEDEENNYYSIGGDEHNELEEDKGD